MRYLNSALLLLLLTACSTHPAIKSLQDVPTLLGLVSARDYDMAHDTYYESFAKQIFLSTFYLWDIPQGQTDVEFFVLIDAYKNEGSQHEFYQTELPQVGWREDDTLFEASLRRWYFKSRRGKQTFLTTYIKIPQSSDAIVVRALYPVFK